LFWLANHGTINHGYLVTTASGALQTSIDCELDYAVKGLYSRDKRMDIDACFFMPEALIALIFRTSFTVATTYNLYAKLHEILNGSPITFDMSQPLPLLLEAESYQCLLVNGCYYRCGNF